MILTRRSPQESLFRRWMPVVARTHHTVLATDPICPTIPNYASGTDIRYGDTHLYFHQYVKDRSILLCKHFSFRPVFGGITTSPPCRYAFYGLPMRPFFRLHPQNRPFRQNYLQSSSDARRLSLGCEKGVWDCLCHLLHGSPLVRAYYLRWHTLDGQTCLYASLGHAPCADGLAIE